MGEGDVVGEALAAAHRSYTSERACSGLVSVARARRGACRRPGVSLVYHYQSGHCTQLENLHTITYICVKGSHLRFGYQMYATMHLAAAWLVVFAVLVASPCRRWRQCTVNFLVNPSAEGWWPQRGDVFPGPAGLQRAGESCCHFGRGAGDRGQGASTGCACPVN
eukprot:COSAG02_NODE_2457_length_8810_cov_4.343933_6_plen_165_part_00